MLLKNTFIKYRNLFRSSAKAVCELEYKQRRLVMEQNILHLHESGVTDTQYGDHDIIVSLTTYGKRIYEVAVTIESIMEQTMKANRIILWIDYNFRDKPLPMNLKILQKRGLEIEYCKDIRSYTKLIPSLRKYPDAAIITIDDDLIYNYDVLEHLIVAYQQDPQYIYCHRMHRIILDKKGNILPYFSWEWESKNKTASHLNFPTGVGSVLYPPHCLAPEVTDEKTFLNICKYADDIWFKAMALKVGTKSKLVYSSNPYGNDYLINENVQDIGLININGGNNLNDTQLKAVFEKYNLYRLLNK